MVKDFIWNQDKEPHLARRKAILAEYPEIRSLFGIDTGLKFKTLFVVGLQLTVPFFLPENPLLYAALVYFVGATSSHFLFLAIHEITHDLAFKKERDNNLLSLIANFPLVFPFAMAFKVYHGKHHWNQGVDGIDTDIPSRFETQLFRGFFGKMIWMLNQIVFYAIRPLMVLPLKPTGWQITNMIVQFSFVTVYYQFVGWQGLLYLLLSLFLAGGFHPVAGHFIAEHYVVKEGQETYSYYGPLNLLTLNVGYHNEHHDFPNIPGSRLPKARSIAAKYYDNLYAHKSWVGVLWRFLTNPQQKLTSRVKRTEQRV